MSSTAIEDVADSIAEERTFRASLRESFTLSTGRGRAAIASGILFLITPTLAVFGSPWLLLLVIPAALLSIVGLAGLHGSGSAGRLGATGIIMKS